MRDLIGSSLLDPRKSGRDLPVLRDDFMFPMEQVLNKFFDEFFADKNLQSVRAASGYPRMDVFEYNGKWIVQLAVPGSGSDDVKVEILPKSTDCYPSYNLLRITGSLASEYKTSDVSYHLRELRRSKFSRVLTLPEWIDDDPEAVLKDGILTLSWDLPKKEEPTESIRNISIKKE